MNCQEFVDFMMAFLDDELPEQQRSAFDRHTTDCPSCVTYLDTYRETVRLGKSALCESPDAPVPEEVPEDLIQAILAAREQ